MFYTSLSYCIRVVFSNTKYFTVVGGEGGGLLFISAKRINVRGESCFGGLKTKLQGTFENFNVSPRGFGQVWLRRCIFIPEDENAITSLDNYGL